jgi:hypothetical protein
MCMSQKLILKNSRRIFLGVKFLSMPSFGREVNPFVPRRRFAARKRTLFDYVEVGSQAKLVIHFSLELPSFSNRGLFLAGFYTRSLFSGGGCLTNSVEERGQREWGSGGRQPPS